MKQPPLCIGITAGDINGIGPEAALKAAYGARWPADVRRVLVGPAAILREQARHFGFPEPATRPGATAVSIWDPTPNLRLRWRPGRLDPAASRAAAGWIASAVAACQRGDLAAMVTAPISKEGFHRAGIDVPGHTEMIAELTGTRRFAMMLYGRGLRVVLATRHIPLKDVPARITRALIVNNVRIADEALRWMGLDRRRIAVCGLNPHAGEGGDIGREEIRVIAPALRALTKKGFDVHGPLSGDTVFHFAAAGEYDAVIAMYHDQGLAPLKLHAFDQGVNLTLGLPIVRTSPDHGTAFAIAGKGVARPDSMIEAIRQAALLARRPNPWRRPART